MRRCTRGFLRRTTSMKKCQGIVQGDEEFDNLRTVTEWDTCPRAQGPPLPGGARHTIHRGAREPQPQVWRGGGLLPPASSTRVPCGCLPPCLWVVVGVGGWDSSKLPKPTNILHQLGPCMNLIPDALCFSHCTIDTGIDTCAHTQAVFTQSVCLKKAYHTIHST